MRRLWRERECVTRGGTVASLGGLKYCTSYPDTLFRRASGSRNHRRRQKRNPPERAEEPASDTPRPHPSRSARSKNPKIPFCVWILNGREPVSNSPLSKHIVTPPRRMEQTSKSTNAIQKRPDDSLAIGAANLFGVGW